MYQKNKDIHLALLDYHNSPQQEHKLSAAQKPLCTRGILSMMPSLLQPAVAYSGTVKQRLRGTVPEQITKTEIWETSIMLFNKDCGYNM